MKIGIFDPYLDDLGGGEKYMMSIAECLSLHHEVVVFWDDASVRQRLSERFSLNLKEIKFVKNIFSSKMSTLKRIAESSKFDMIIILSDGSVPILLSRTFLHIQQPLSEIKLKFSEKLKLKKINGIFCNSEYTKKYIDRNFNINSKILYPPIVLKPKNIKKENIILHVGRFRVQISGENPKDFKKQFLMVEAFLNLIDVHALKDWKLVMCVSVKKEDEDTFEVLREKAKKYPIEFALNKSNDQLWEYYSKAKIYWHASGYVEDLDKKPELAEHFGISTVEAMGAGAVPVVINVGGQKEIVRSGEDGYLWDSLEELQSQTLKLINDVDILEKMSKSSIERANYFKSLNFCKTLETILGLT